MTTLSEYKAKLRPVPAILSTHLRDLKVRGNGWASALCPYHDDNNASFSVHTSSGHWKCFACDQSGSYFELPGNPAEPQPTNVYEYTQEGTVKYVKVRYFPKTFRIFSVGADGSLTPGKPPGYELLYGFDRINAQTGDVFIVEGEKDCDALRDRGILAVTGGGASQWSPEWSAALHSRRTYLLPDQDDAGAAWVKRVCATLKPEGVVSFPVAGIKDVSEWFETGHEFKNLVVKPINGAAQSKDQLNEVIELCSYEGPIREPDIIESFVPRGFITVLYGDGGEGKSFISLIWAHYLALGQEIKGLKISPSRTLYLDWELDAQEHSNRATKIAKGMDLSKPPPGVFYKKMSNSYFKEAERIQDDIKRYNIQLVIVDSLAGACGGDTNHSTEIISLFTAMLKLGVSIIIIDHMAKVGDAGETFKPFGSVYKFNLARSVIKVIKQEETTKGPRVKLLQYKNNLGPLHDPMVLTLEFTPDSVVMA